jgi:tetratricopeptide (TPR) repeat protein
MLICGVIAAAEPAGDWTHLGHVRYERCDFKAAMQAFSRAAARRPDDADLQHWLGKSYAKLAETDGPLLASRHAAKARLNLERAVTLDPANRHYLRELFDFYLDSPEWLSGGIDQAEQLIVRLEPEDAGAQAFLRLRLENARQDFRGVYWRMRQATLIPPAQLSRVLR